MACPSRDEAGSGPAPWRLSGGEIHFLWAFIDGGIMEPDTRWALRRAWGMCPRHALGFLSVTAAFRSGHMHGPAVLYDDLLRRGVAALRHRGVAAEQLAARRLRDAGMCLMCALGYGPASRGRPSREVLRRGEDVRALHRFVRGTMSSWQRWVCGACAGTEADVLCRAHLREALATGSASLEAQRSRVEGLALHVGRYARSFRWESRGTDTAEDRAALVAAVGWCGGWRILLDFAGVSPTGGQPTRRSPGRDPAER